MYAMNHTVGGNNDEMLSFVSTIRTYFIKFTSILFYCSTVLN